MMIFMICAPHQIFSDKIKDIEMDRVCGMYGEEKCIQGFCGET
jgi:hypothetical protein